VRSFRLSGGQQARALRLCPAKSPSSPWRNLTFLSGDSEEDEGRDGATERAAAEK
jgi:hypothetical protein